MLPAGTATCTLTATARVVNGAGASRPRRDADRDPQRQRDHAVVERHRRPVARAYRSSLGSKGRGGDTLRIRLGYEVPTGVVPRAGDGVWFDDLDLSCMQPPGRTSGYGWMSGTSMATPYVSGAAALLFSLRPQATVAQVRAALLSSVTKLPAFSGVTTTGGRLNVPAAMSALAAVVPGPPLPAGFGEPTSPPEQPPPVQTTPQPLPTVTTPTPAPLPAPTTTQPQQTTPTRAAVRCVVPRLTGRTLAQARTLLKRAHCAVGRVSRPRGATRRLVVKTSSPRAGSRRTSGARVALTLTPKAKAKQRR